MQDDFETKKEENFEKLLTMEETPERWCAICFLDLTGKQWFSTPSHIKQPLPIYYCVGCKPPIYSPENIQSGIVIVGGEEEE